MNSRVHACSVCYCAWWYVDRLCLESVCVMIARSVAWYYDLRFCWQSCRICKPCHMWQLVIGWMVLNICKDCKCTHHQGRVITRIYSVTFQRSLIFFYCHRNIKNNENFAVLGFLCSEYPAISEKRWSWSSTLNMWTGRIAWLREGHGNFSYVSWERESRQPPQ
jgi:hypothetical protein